MDFHYKVYFFSLICIHLVHALVFVGLLSTVPEYIEVWTIFVQLFICLFLMIRFHPFRKKYNFSQIDAKIIFGCAMLLFINIFTLPEPYSHVLNFFFDAPSP